MELLTPCNDPQFTTRTVTYTGAAGTTAAWPSGPQGVLVWSTSDAYIRVVDGATVGATVADTPIPANTPVPFKVPNTGIPWSVSAIQISAGGTLFAKPINKE
jgi:hypothetical protein